MILKSLAQQERLLSVGETSPLHSLTGISRSQGSMSCNRLVTTVTNRQSNEELNISGAVSIFFRRTSSTVVSEINQNTRFPLFRRMTRAFTGRWARRIYLVVLSLLLLVTAGGRLRSYIVARRIEAVLRGFAEIRLDQTTEEQLTKTVPYLAQREWTDRGGVLHRRFVMHISNESDLWLSWLIELRAERLGYVADWLGYRFISLMQMYWCKTGRSRVLSTAWRISGSVRSVQAIPATWSRPAAYTDIGSIGAFLF
jgi:hypothetical protein